MHITLFIALAIQALSNPSASTNFDEAVQKKLIIVSAKANENSTHYQQPILLEIKNITANPIAVELPVGRYFQSRDTTDQSFVSTEPLMVSLSPGQMKSIPVSAMCVNHHKSAPGAGDVYLVKNPAKDKMLKTAEYVHTHKLSGSYLGQTIMWCISDNEPLESVFAYSEAGISDAYSFLTNLTGRPVPPPPAANDYLRNPRAKPKIELGGSFEFQFSRPKAIHIAMFDENNIAVRELYNNPTEPAGAHKVDYVFDASVYNGNKYYIRFLCDNQILMEQEIEI